jgi:hypothetical protein
VVHFPDSREEKEAQEPREFDRSANRHCWPVQRLRMGNPKPTFDEVARKELGPSPFPNTPNGRKFKRECKAGFDAERGI